jgi:hypothetical protein
MEQTLREDPYYARLKQIERDQKLKGKESLPNIQTSSHLWRGMLPTDLTPGTHRISIKTTDMFGKTYTGERLIKVE